MEKDIGKITKNDNTDVIVRVDDFGGRVGVTIREFVTGDRYTGFTKAGTRISAENFPKFKEMINSISDEEIKAMQQEVEANKEGSEPSQDQKKLNNSDEVKTEKPGQDSGDLPDY